MEYGSLGTGLFSQSSSASASQTQWWLSHVELTKNYGGTAAATLNSGNETVGCMFNLLRGVTITGIRFYATFASYNKSVKCGLWNITQGNVELANQTVTVTAAGIYTATFASPYVVPNNRIGDQYAVGMWETTGTSYTEMDSISFNNINNVMNGPSVFVYAFNSYNGPGYTCPGSTGAALLPFPIEPIIL